MTKQTKKPVKKTAAKPAAKKAPVKKKAAPKRPTPIAVGRMIFEASHGTTITKTIRDKKRLQEAGINPAHIDAAATRHANKLKKAHKEALEAQIKKEMKRPKSEIKSDVRNALPTRKTNGQVSKENWKAVREDKKTREGVFRFCTQYCPCQDAGGKNNVAGLLMHATDLKTVSVERAARDMKVLRHVGLTPKQITPDVIAQAKGMERAWSMKLNERIDAYNNRIDEINRANGFGPAEVTEAKLGTTNKHLAKDAEKKKRVKGEKKEKVKKEPVVKDRFTNKVGTQAAFINELLSKKPITAQAVSDKLGYPVSRVKSHMKFLLERKFIVESKKGFAVK